MKLYLSSYRIPNVAELEELVGRPLTEMHVALIPNAKDYYARRAWEFKIKNFTDYLDELGVARVRVVDLRDFEEPDALVTELADEDLIWALGGNTYCLRFEMQRSGFDDAITQLLAEGVVYGGDSAGALVAGESINGIEAVDIPEFAEHYISDGLDLVPDIILPHVDNPNFLETLTTVRQLHADQNIVELKDSEAVIFEGDEYRIVDGTDGVIDQP